MDALLTMAKGILIGIANIIPGVSGGTLALMLGIYKRIIDALGNVNAELFRKTMAAIMLRRGAGRSFWRYVQDADLLFLGWLGGGAVAAILLTSRLMAWLLDRHHAASYAFFLGLVLCSIIFPWRYLTRRSWREVVVMMLAAVLTVGLSLAVSDQEQISKAERKHEMAMAKAAAALDAGSTPLETAAVKTEIDARRLVVIFLAAILAISAMVLPGISGSFVLLLLGVYFDILGAINQRDLLVLAVFAAGALFGLLAFSRLMGALLNRFFNVTMAFMTGLMAGSLYELWPFKRMEQIGGETLYLSSIWRGASVTEEITALAAFAGGCVIVIGFALASRGRERNWNSVLR